MLFKATKLKLAALLIAAGMHSAAYAALVAGVETNDLVKPSADLDKVFKTLETEQAKIQKDPHNANANGDWTKAFNAAVTQVQELANKGDTNAAYVLAKWGILVGGNNVNVNSIVDLYRKAGAIPAAQIELAQVLLQGFRQDADKTREAVNLIVEAEKAGNKLARRMKAQLHLSGSAAPIVAQDNKAAVELLEKASTEGDGEATLGLYQIYSRGITGYAQDFAKALEYLKTAAEKQANATALGEYGARLLAGDTGDGKTAPNLVTKNVQQALKMFEDAAKGGLAAANRILGQIYEGGVGEKGIDVKPDVKKAIEYYGKAAQGSDPAALFRLAQASETGIAAPDAKPDDKGNWDPKDILVQPNGKNALDLYRLAAQNNAPEAFFAVGRFYETGTVVDKDPEKAFALYIRAANAGVLAAMNQLAGLYANGAGVTQDIIAAGGWYKRAADNGYAPAKIAYGMMAEQGTGVERSGVVAERYYSEAAAQGAPLAMVRLSTLHLSGVEAGKPNYPLAWAYAQLASEATKGQSAEINQYVAALEDAKKEDKKVFTEEVIKQGKAELEKLKKTLNITAAPAAAASAEPAAAASKSDAKKKAVK
jgi:TPR repeat protein